MKPTPTLKEIAAVLVEIKRTMDTSSEAMLPKLAGLYVATYIYKLRLLAKETPRAGR